VAWINEAVVAGARKSEACKLVMINIRTLQRWCDGDCISADKRPDAVRKMPTNSLSEQERQRILAVCNDCLLYTSPSPRDRTRSRMPSSA